MLKRAVLVDSYAERIAAAEGELTNARAARDRLYPGSMEWERAQGKVEEWESALRELRREARHGGPLGV